MSSFRKRDLLPVIRLRRCGAERWLKKVAFYPLALELELRRSEQQL